jgi:hypothetical protein
MRSRGASSATMATAPRHRLRRWWLDRPVRTKGLSQTSHELRKPLDLAELGALLDSGTNPARGGGADLAARAASV